MTESERRHFEVVLEQILHEVRTVAEGHEVLRNEIKTSHNELEEKINLNTSLIKHGVETLDARIDGVENRLSVRIDGVRDELRETREVLSAEIQAVGEKVDGHENRITRLEQKVA